MTPLLARRSAPSRTLERLYRHHARDVYRTALALLRNPQEAEDATQTAFLNAYRALMRGEKPREPRSWMLAIVHNVVRMRNRTLSRRPNEVPLNPEHEPVTDEMPVDLEPVLEALARLPLNQRAAIVMREVEGRTYAEIASVLGVTVSSVEALIFRARRNLRMDREALGVLSLAPLPASLLAASGAGVGGAAALLGSDAVLKAAAVVAAAGVMVGGASFHTSGHAMAGNRRSGPAVSGSARVPVKTSPAAFTSHAAPAAPVARPHARAPRRHARETRETRETVVFTPIAASDTDAGGDSASPGAHRRAVPLAPVPEPGPMPKPTPDPRPPTHSPKAPPQPPPPAQQPEPPAPTVDLPLAALPLPTVVDPSVPTVQVQLQVQQLPALPAATTVLASISSLPSTPSIPPTAPLPLLP